MRILSARIDLYDLDPPDLHFLVKVQGVVIKCHVLGDGGWFFHPVSLPPRATLHKRGWFLVQNGVLTFLREASPEEREAVRTVEENFLDLVQEAWVLSSRRVRG